VTSARFVESDLSTARAADGAFDVVYARASCTTRRTRARLRRVGALASRAAWSWWGSTTPWRGSRSAAPAVAPRDRLSLDPVRPGAARPGERAGRARGLAARPVPPPRGTPAHGGRGAALVRGATVDFVRAFPRPRCTDEAPDDLFAPQPDAWAPERWLAQIGWIGSLGHEGGLFVMVGRRRETAPDV
jgi:hypothetical protein